MATSIKEASTPGPLDPSAPISDPGLKKDSAQSPGPSPDLRSDSPPDLNNTSNSIPGFLKDSTADSPKVEKTTQNVIGNPVSVKNLKVLHVQDLPAQLDYEVILNSFCSFGPIMEIRMNYLDTKLQWEAWITFANHSDALKACSNIKTIKVEDKTVNGALTDSPKKYGSIHTF